MQNTVDRCYNKFCAYVGSDVLMSSISQKRPHDFDAEADATSDNKRRKIEVECNGFQESAENVELLNTGKFNIECIVVMVMMYSERTFYSMCV